jgi:bifunctional non-homologous end joining protein LigD
VAAAVATIRARRALLDGEIVAVDARGRPSFQALQHRSMLTRHTLVFYTFDVLAENGKDLTREPIEARRNRLRAIAGGTGVLLSEPLPGTPAHIERELRQLGLEGAVAKRVGSRYESGKRTGAWTKVKFQRAQEFVIGGFSPDGKRVDALVVGHYESRRLLAAGKVRAGLTPRSRRDLYDLLKSLRTVRCPFVNLPNSAGKNRWGEGITAEEMATIIWLNPQRVAQVAFTEWTADGNLRHARFLRLREDVRARDIRRER